MSTERGTSREFQDEALWRLLPAAISPLVHDLNNSLVVLGGAVEVASRAMVPVADREVDRMRIALAHLSTLSKPTDFAGERRALFDLATVLEGVESLVAPLARVLGIELRLPTGGRAPERSTVLRGQAQAFERLLVLTVLAELLAMRDAGLGRPQGRVAPPAPEAELHAAPVCSLRLERRPGRAVLHLTRERPGPRDQGASETLGRAFRESRALDMSVGFRPLGHALAYRFDLGAALEEQQPEGREAIGGSLLLAGGEPDERETIAAFLASEGFEVRILERVSDPVELTAPRADLVLIDAALCRESPQARHAIEGDRHLLASTLVLGAEEEGSPFVLPGAPGPRTLPRPFRPGQLLDAVRTRLAQERRASAG